MFTWTSFGAALPRIYCYLLGLSAEQYGAAGCQGESSMLQAASRGSAVAGEAEPAWSRPGTACRPRQRPGRPLTYSGPVRQG
jgi:hypothetical protein